MPAVASHHITRYFWRFDERNTRLELNGLAFKVETTALNTVHEKWALSIRNAKHGVIGPFYDLGICFAVAGIFLCVAFLAFNAATLSWRAILLSLRYMPPEKVPNLIKRASGVPALPQSAQESAELGFYMIVRTFITV